MCVNLCLFCFTQNLKHSFVLAAWVDMLIKMFGLNLFLFNPWNLILHGRLLSCSFKSSDHKGKVSELHFNRQNLWFSSLPMWTKMSSYNTAEIYLWPSRWQIVSRCRNPAASWDKHSQRCSGLEGQAKKGPTKQRQNCASGSHLGVWIPQFTYLPSPDSIWRNCFLISVLESI